MGCGACGGGGILPGSLTARKNKLLRNGRRVRGYSGSGVLKSPKKKVTEEVAAEEKEANASE